jgi:hypothetical protein
MNGMFLILAGAITGASRMAPLAGGSFSAGIASSRKRRKMKRRQT